MAAPASTLQALSSIVSQLKAVNVKLDADCTLRISDLRPAEALLQHVCQLSGSLKQHTSVTLDEALASMRELRLCELLLSLLRRWPWAETRQENKRAQSQFGLMLLPEVLSSLCALLCVASRVRSSQRAAAYAEMNIRYLCARVLVPRRAWVQFAVVNLHCKESKNISVELLCFACPALTACFFPSRYAELQVFEVLTASAARLVEVARELAPSFDAAAAVGFSAYYMLEAGQPRPMSLHIICLASVVRCTGAG